MIPPFTSDGTLPSGIHWIAWDELYTRFGHNEYRRNLLFGMQSGLHSLRQAGCQEVYIDGSFCTYKELPGDFDICYEDHSIDWDWLINNDPILLDFSNRRAAQKTKYLGEFFPFSGIAAPPNLTYLEFFQIDKHTGAPKGILGLKL